MAKKGKERNELEVLRAENNKLKSQNRHLKKSVSRKEKRALRYEDLEIKEAEILLKEEVDERLEETIQIKKTNACPKCGDDLEIFGGDKIKIYICGDCNYRMSRRG